MPVGAGAAMQIYETEYSGRSEDGFRRVERMTRQWIGLGVMNIVVIVTALSVVVNLLWPRKFEIILFFLIFPRSLWFETHQSWECSYLIAKQEKSNVNIGKYSSTGWAGTIIGLEWDWA